MSNPAASTTDPFELVVPSSRRTDLYRILFMVVMVAGSISAWWMQPDPDAGFNSRIALWVTRYLGPPVSLGFLVYAIRLCFDSRPVLVVNAQGIRTRYSGLIPWSEVAEVKAGKLRNVRALLIYARDVERLAAGSAPAEAKSMRWNAVSEGFVAAVGESQISIKIADLMAQIGEYSAARIRAYDAVATEAGTAPGTPSPRG